MKNFWEFWLQVRADEEVHQLGGGQTADWWIFTRKKTFPKCAIKATTMIMKAYRIQVWE
jgi:hypothetical protein